MIGSAREDSLGHDGVVARQEDRDDDRRDDVESLLAEVERSLGGGSTGPPQRRADSPPARTSRIRSAAVTGAVAGGVVWVLFALLPFLRAGSGAIGAFLATFVVLLVLGRRR